MAGTGKLEKLTIKAFADDKFSKPVEDGVFVAQVNPEKVSFKYQIELEEQQGHGTSAAQPRYGKTKPEELTFQFLFDATGAVPLPDGKPAISPQGIVPRLDHLKRVALNFNGDEHKPNNLLLAWGTLIFKCVLAEMNLDYTLFRADGTPLRATAACKFVGYVEDTLRVSKDKLKSPDLTHARVVKDGDTLQGHAVAIYGTPDHYLALARANGLANFRRLRRGQVLHFPPLAKEGPNHA